MPGFSADHRAAVKRVENVCTLRSGLAWNSWGGGHIWQLPLFYWCNTAEIHSGPFRGVLRLEVKHRGAEGWAWMDTDEDNKIALHKVLVVLVIALSQILQVSHS